MHIVTGATGHIGSAVALTLLKHGEQVLIITRSEKKANEWRNKGAHAAVVDVNNTEALHEVFCKGKRLFLLNPPASPDKDTIKEELESMRSMLKALEGTPIEKVVAQSTYGAQPGEGNGDMNVLYYMESGLKDLDITVSIIRGAYYMSNWDGQVEAAVKEGKVHSLYPVEFKLPMVAPQNIGEFAAHLMMAPLEESGLHYVEGPEPYSCSEVAEALSDTLNKPVEAVQIPPSEWMTALQAMGFSEPAARSMARMTHTTLELDFEMADAPYRGHTSLKEYFQHHTAASAYAVPA